MLYMVTFTINIPQLLGYILYIPSMDPMGTGWGPRSIAFSCLISDEKTDGFW